MSFLFIILTALLTLISFDASAETMYVYRNVENTEAMDLSFSRRIFTGESLSWNGGKNIVVLVLSMDQIDDDEFASFSKLSKTQFLSKWRIKFFSGRALMPLQLKASGPAIETLKSNSSGVFFSFTELTAKEMGEDKKGLRVDRISY